MVCFDYCLRRRLGLPCINAQGKNHFTGTKSNVSNNDFRNDFDHGDFMKSLPLFYDRAE
jgi:hypothetical protein